MSITAKEKFLSSQLKKVVFYVVILLAITVFFRPLDLSINVSSARNFEWSVTLYFNEPSGANNNLIFGEVSDASDGQDNYDIPIPPPGIPPYIRPWFDSGLNEPYDSLFYDIKKYSDNSKIWDLYVQWVPSDYVSSSNITISWNTSEVSASEYESVVLYDYDNEVIVANMQIDSNYTYTSSAMITHYYQIICNSNFEPLNHPPYQPSNPYPQDGVKDVNIASIVTWTGGDPDEGDTVTYDVYFGKTPSPPKVSNNQSSTSYDTGSLSYNTNYYWKIVAWDKKGLRTEGSIWQFSTESYILPPQNIPPIADANGPYQGYVYQIITFDASSSSDSDGIIEYYRWDFTNDNTWDTEWIEEEFITHTYLTTGNYSLKLQVKDDLGATDISISQVTILLLEKDKEIPVADANGPYSGLINQSITFDATGSYDTDGFLINYTWNLGDGTKNYNMKATHKYITQGTYNITLIVMDNDGYTNVDKTKAHIFDRDSDQDGWGDDEEKKYGTDPNNSEDFPLDTDNDHIPDSEDDNDDNDGLSDNLEEKLGSDPKNKSDVISISIKGITHFLIDTNKDDISDLFYNSRSGNTSKVDYKENNKYLLDVDGDGLWDYVYDHTYGTFTEYKEEEPSSYPLLPVIAVLSICLVLLFFITLKFFLKKS